MHGERHHSSQPLDDELLLSVQRHECPHCGKHCRKPLIRVVCPVCAKVVMVNALDREGEVTTLCSKCPKTSIAIATDDNGCITDINGWSEAPEEKKPMDWRIVAGAVVLALFMLLMIANAFRSTEGSRSPVQPAEAPAANGRAAPETEADLSSPSSGETAPVADANNGQPAPNASPATLDMFAPERK